MSSAQKAYSGPSMFAGAHQQAFENSDFRAAGRDMYNGTTVNFNITPPDPLNSISRTSTTSARLLVESSRGSLVPTLTIHTPMIPNPQGSSSRRGRGLVRILRLLKPGASSSKQGQVEHSRSSNQGSGSTGSPPPDQHSKEFTVVCSGVEQKH